MNFNKSSPKKYRVLVVADGSVHDLKSWSGINYHFYEAFKKLCQVVKVINCNFRAPGRIASNYQIEYIAESAKICEKIIERTKKPYDFILQLGLMPYLKYKAPYVIYFGNTLIQWLRITYSWPHCTLSERRKIFFDKYIEIERNSFMGASRIFTLGKYIRKSFVRDYGVDAGRVISVGAGPNISHLPKIDKRYDGKTILFIGTDIVRKGGAVLLRAFEKVKEKIPDAKLILASSAFKKFSKGKDYENHGIFVKGFIDKRLRGFLYRKASVFVMPSIHDVFGIVFLEAMAYKLPCIGSNIEAMAEMIDDGKTGFVVPVNNADKLAEKIIFILTHKKTARRMGECGRRKVERYYNWDRVVGRIVSEMAAVINKN